MTLTNLEQTFKSVRDHVDKSRNQWVAREALSTRVESEENAEERAKRIALELSATTRKRRRSKRTSSMSSRKKESRKAKKRKNRRSDETPR